MPCAEMRFSVRVYSGPQEEDTLEQGKNGVDQVEPLLSTTYKIDVGSFAADMLMLRWALERHLGLDE